MTIRILLLLGVAGVATAFPAEPAAHANTAIEPVLRNDWLQRHDDFLKQPKAGAVPLLFLGDSITDFWRSRGLAVWNEFYAPMKAVNLGVGGDRTQHVLWRLQNGEADGISPQVTVVMIGTNNLGANTVAEVTEGVTAVVHDLRQRLPKTKILLLAIFPRADRADNPLRLKAVAVNAELARLHDGEHVFFLDLGSAFLLPDGTLTASVMDDYLHPTELGYRIWARTMAPKLKELLDQP